MTDQAIPAATLIVARELEAGPPELLMVERAPGMAFAGGALVFPGGRIDDADVALAQKLGVPGEAPRIAAIRETIEETAIAVGLVPGLDPGDAIGMQERLVGGEAFGELIETTGAKFDLDALTPFARWVPKFHATRRFDTMFYVARLADGNWTPRIVESECTGAHWMTAAEALERDRTGRAQLIFPTRRTLERLAQHDDFAAIAADAAAHAIEPVTPWIEEIDGERFITIPGHLGYPNVREKLDGLWRG